MPTETERGHGDVMASGDRNAVITISLAIIVTFLLIFSFYAGTIRGVNLTMQSHYCKAITK